MTVFKTGQNRGTRRNSCFEHNDESGHAFNKITCISVKPAQGRLEPGLELGQGGFRFGAGSQARGSTRQAKSWVGRLLSQG